MKKLMMTVALVLTAGAAQADPVEGMWETEVDDGAYAHINIKPCGSAYCGFIAKSFKDTYKVDLKERLKEDMGGAELDQANALMEGNQSKAAAAKIKTATEGFWGADKTGINDSLNRLIPAIEAANAKIGG